MRSWSEMARKIAHELRNPLMPMGMAADRVSQSQEPSISAAGEVLREEIQRLEALARTFAHFGRPPDGPMSSIDLTEMLSLLAYRLSAEGMSVRFEPPEEHLFVMGHLDALERVVRNLLSNAQDSVGARAAMDIRDGKGDRQPEEGDPEPIQIDLMPSERAVIQVSLGRTSISQESTSQAASNAAIGMSAPSTTSNFRGYGTPSSRRYAAMGSNSGLTPRCQGVARHDVSPRRGPQEHTLSLDWPTGPGPTWGRSAFRSPVLSERERQIQPGAPFFARPQLHTDVCSMVINHPRIQRTRGLDREHSFDRDLPTGDRRAQLHRL